MKEILKSKVMVGFVIFVLGFTYVGSIQMNRLNQLNESNREILYIK